MNSEYHSLVESYLGWLRNRTQLKEVDGACEITTPFKDRHNDRIQIYVEPKASGGYELHDDGYTISDLNMAGCSLRTPHRKQMLDTILKGLGVRETNEVLLVDASKDTFPQRKHALLQAILTVNDMFMTAKHHVAKFFLEDVESFLDTHDVRYIPDAHFLGKSGFNHHFDFIIPRSSSQPERILKAINNPNKNSATSLLFAWTDTKINRSNKSRLFAILNDSEKPLNSEITSAFRFYDVQTILWSERNLYVDTLAS